MYRASTSTSEQSQCGACAVKSNSTQICFFGLSNSPLFLKKKERVKFREFRWFEKKNLVAISLKVESIQFYFLTRKKRQFEDSQPKLGGKGFTQFYRADVESLWTVMMMRATTG